ncbi:MAG: RnfABCDGE type electron transport complex subunit D [Oscillospiraceae bacterium]|nr:RnfABCDGE type electron transport complex subunit D [Oscillospiraceae bacterium]
MNVKLDTTSLHLSFRPFRDYLVTMVPIAALSTFVYGWRVLIMLGIATIVAELSDFIVAFLRKNTLDLSDISSVTLAWVFTMLMPASLSYTILIIGVCITVFLGKHAFGGFGSYPFNPAAFGFAFTAAAYPDEVFRYPAAFSNVPISWAPQVELFRSPGYVINQGGKPIASVTDLIIGEYVGPIGTTFCIVALSCLVLLIVHDAMSWHIPAAYMATFAALTFAFPRIQVDRTDSMLMELICGFVPFAAAYLVSEPSSSPKNDVAKIIYGIVLGAVSVLFTWYGAFEGGICFALLVCSPVGSYLDRKLAGTRSRKGDSTNA